MRTLLTIAYLGNLIDTLATLHLHSLGYTEANPVMARLLQSPAAFFAVKIAAMTAVVLWLWHRRKYRKALAAAVVAAVVYGSLAIYYVLFFTVWI